MRDLAKPDDELKKSLKDGDDLELTTIEHYLETGESEFGIGNCAVLDATDGIGTGIVSDGWLYTISDGWGTSHVEGKIRAGRPVKLPDLQKLGAIEGRLLPGRKGNKFCLARNGDIADVEELLNFENDELYGPTFSFRCLGRFLTKSEDEKTQTEVAMTALTDGSLKIVDFTPDCRIKPNKNIIKAWKDRGFAHVQCRYKAPQKGYTLIMDSNDELIWHRPSTVVFHTKGKNSLILGVDGNSYFGVEIDGQPKSVADALLLLAPVEARNGQGLKPGVLRQGEWFAIPCPEKSVPSEQNCCCFTDQSVTFPVEPGGNSHSLLGGEIRIGCDGNVYAEGFTLGHDEHGELEANDGWYSFRKNTALRSFSQQGVD